jgi:hypothetical protein
MEVLEGCGSRKRTQGFLVPTSTAVWVTFLSSVVSGVIGILISTWFYRRYEKRKLKIDTFRRLLGSRHAAISGSSTGSQDAFFSALNEVLAVFHNSRRTLDALRTLHAELAQPGRFDDNLVALFRTICDDLSIARNAVNDSFFLRPFTPGSTLRNSTPLQPVAAAPAAPSTK